MNTQMIPIRVRADAPAYAALTGRTLAADHPLAGASCPVCTDRLGTGPITLVYVGIPPESQREGKRYTTGAAIAVHDGCAPPAAVGPKEIP